VVVAVDNFAEPDLSSEQFAEHEGIEGQEQFVVFAKFVREDEADGNELGGLPDLRMARVRRREGGIRRS